jgi:hypothetical protein
MLATQLSFIPAVLIIGSAGIIALVAYYFRNDNVIARTLKKHKKKSIQSAQNNQITRLEGRALFVNEPLQGPFSGRDCIYYQAVVQQKGKNGWYNIVKEVKRQDFFLKVDNEIALIKANADDKSVRLHLVKDHHQYSGIGKDAPNKIEDFLKRHNKSSTAFFNLMNKSLRYREGIIALEEMITVLGVAQWKSLSEPIEGYSYSKIMTLNATDKQKLIVTDDPKHQGQ